MSPRFFLNVVCDFSHSKNKNVIIYIIRIRYVNVFANRVGAQRKSLVFKWIQGFCEVNKRSGLVEILYAIR